LGDLGVDDRTVVHCDGFAQIIARQRLGKHVPTRNNRSVFYVVRCYAAASGPVDWLDSDYVGTPTDEHATIAQACFLCVGSVQSGYKRGEFRSWQFRVRVQLSGGDSHGKFVVEELEVSL
jgi:hypothetical protein